MTPAEAEAYLFASYLRALPHLHGPDARVRDPSLTEALLRALELSAPPLLLVAGSKGKGSTAALAAQALRATGARVGLMISPHLVDFRERIRVDGRAIPPADFVRQVERLRLHADRLAAALPSDRYLSPTGLTFVVALLHWRDQRVDLAVVEAGRGARFDDTRVAGHRVAALTPIFVEHPRELGATLAEVAWHKAGAIPRAGVAVSAFQAAEAAEVLRAEAVTLGAALYVVGREIQVVATPAAEGQVVTVVTPAARYEALPLPLRGAHQAENLALALAAAEALHPPLARVERERLRALLARLRWPGRCEVLAERPRVMVDGAINAASAARFAEAAAPLLQPPVVAVSAVPADKDYEGAFRVLAGLAPTLIVTRARNPYLTFPDDALAVAARYAREALAAPTLAEALALARPRVGDEGTICIVGTQSLVADAQRLFGRDLGSLDGPPGVPGQENTGLSGEPLP